MSNSRKTLVLGLGNTLLGDEGAGVRAMERMRAAHPAAGVEYLDGGTLSFTLAGHVEDAENLVVMDAANLGGSAGEWRCFADGQIDRFLTQRGRSVHEVSLSDLLDIARLTGRLPRRRALFGIQPLRVDWDEQLSPAVSIAVDEVVADAWRLIQAWRAAGAPS